MPNLTPSAPWFTSRFRRVVPAREDELAALFWSFAYFFSLLCSYYILRPLRDEMGVTIGPQHLEWLFSGTFLVMLAAVPLFGWVVARYPRRRFLPMVYRFFAANILIFFLLFTLDPDSRALAAAFFIWVSVFNLFVVSVFWSFMADLFSNAQAKRLFGFIAAGGSLGALLGPALTALLAVPLGPVNLLLVSAVILEGATFCVRRLGASTAEHGRDRPEDMTQDTSPPSMAAIGGSIWAGISLTLRSPYLRAITLYILLLTTTATFLYFQQAEIVAAAFDDRAERTRVFASIDLLVGILTLVIQTLLTARILTWIGIGGALALLPLVAGLAFAAIAFSPTVGVLIALQGLRRASNFAVAKPAREVLFTVLPAESKYKAKNLVDTLVYRGGDAASGWAFAGLTALGLKITGIALVGIVLAALWAKLGLHLGRAQEHQATTVA